mmetsp:Transcript_15327/g.25900  ORF Transcript_15327/g.25900 Transcript_15327/m.25900 type:complete len:269 (+) Transcript_15327:480-1286(+)
MTVEVAGLEHLVLEESLIARELLKELLEHLACLEQAENDLKLEEGLGLMTVRVEANLVVNDAHAARLAVDLHPDDVVELRGHHLHVGLALLTLPAVADLTLRLLLHKVEKLEQMTVELGLATQEFEHALQVLLKLELALVQLLLVLLAKFRREDGQHLLGLGNGLNLGLPSGLTSQRFALELNAEEGSEGFVKADELGVALADVPGASVALEGLDRDLVLDEVAEVGLTPALELHAELGPAEAAELVLEGRLRPEHAHHRTQTLELAH